MIKKVHKKCMMKGCTNRASYQISLSREIGNSIIICKDCANRAVQMIDDYEKNHSTAKAVDTAEDATETISEVADETEVEAVFLCDNCGKEFQTERGLNAHRKMHDKE